MFYRCCFVVLLFCCFGCLNKDEANTDLPKLTEELKESNFKIIIEGYFKLDDYLFLYYENIQGEGFYEADRLIKTVKGSQNKQTVTIDLPENEVLSNFSLHISEDFNQKVVIDKFTITDGIEKIEVGKDSLFDYLRPNEYIRVLTNGEFDLITKEINGNKAYNPIFKCQQKLMDKLKFI